ncbi:erythromycin esterase family protein [Jeotgalibacillus sp. ET6]|uniref:erythromycin esterase family protein n=1 Tax=Jeotgalibacillus sp. ET6 TaxID=3037260 RepID=UPI002418207F|nr:erythromycin esterase family protein [Jeotgalibacillus sp. ET6]MDG5473188.1 erythromycin esterase family protein [Jeotgalibacillus sp. ET6]
MKNFQFINRKYNRSAEWVKEHSIGMETLIDVKMEDFHFLERVLKNKRIVWMGENGHGVAEHNLLKSKLIEFLYHKMGFKVIAFESGLSECYSSNFLKQKLSVNELMDKSIYSLWKTEETVSLFKLIKETDLNLLGFDFQPSTNQNLFPKFLESIDIDIPVNFILSVKRIDNVTIDWYKRIGKYKASRKKVPKTIAQEYQKDQQELLDVITELNSKLGDLEDEFLKKDLHIFYKIIQKVLSNKRLFLDFLRVDRRSYLKFRDQVMADNIEWICNELYPNERIIIWAHNSHIFKNYETMFKFKPMGSLMTPDIVSHSYYLGLFMYEGKAALDKGTIYDIKKPPKKSLEDYMNHNTKPVSFLDFSSASQNSLNKFLFSKTLILESGTMHKLIIPAEQMDGIFFIKKISPPHYL